ERSSPSSSREEDGELLSLSEIGPGSHRGSTAPFGFASRGVFVLDAESSEEVAVQLLEALGIEMRAEPRVEIARRSRLGELLLQSRQLFIEMRFLDRVPSRFVRRQSRSQAEVRRLDENDRNTAQRLADVPGCLAFGPVERPAGEVDPSALDT